MESVSLRALRCFSWVPPVNFWDLKTALLLIDMQVSCIRPTGYTIRRLRECRLDSAVDQYERQLRSVVPNLMRVLERFRRTGQTVIHTHVVSVKGPVSGWPTEVMRTAPAGSDEAQIINELAPTPGELILPKSCSSVFIGTNLDFLLRRLGITSLVVGGVVTHACVERAIGDGYDLGYSLVLLRDGCASLTDELHNDAMERMEQRRAHVVSTNWLLAHSGVDAADMLTDRPVRRGSSNKS